MVLPHNVHDMMLISVTDEYFRWHHEFLLTENKCSRWIKKNIFSQCVIVKHTLTLSAIKNHQVCKTFKRINNKCW